MLDSKDLAAWQEAIAPFSPLSVWSASNELANFPENQTPLINSLREELASSQKKEAESRRAHLELTILHAQTNIQVLQELDSIRRALSMKEDQVARLKLCKSALERQVAVLRGLILRSAGADPLLKTLRSELAQIRVCFVL